MDYDPKELSPFEVQEILEQFDKEEAELESCLEAEPDD